MTDGAARRGKLYATPRMAHEVQPRAASQRRSRGLEWILPVIEHRSDILRDPRWSACALRENSSDALGQLASACSRCSKATSECRAHHGRGSNGAQRRELRPTHRERPPNQFRPPAARRGRQASRAARFPRTREGGPSGRSIQSELALGRRVIEIMDATVSRLLRAVGQVRRMEARTWRDREGCERAGISGRRRESADCF